MADSGRHDPRFRSRLRVAYRVAGGPERAGFTTDVGPHGLFVLAAPAPPAGRPVELVVALPDAGEARLSGTITWSRQGKPHPGLLRGGFGVRLAGGTEAWYRFCAQLGQGVPEGARAAGSG